MDWSTLRLSGHPPVQVPPPTPENSPIIVVDDEPDVLDLLAGHLREEGYPVSVFQDPWAALDALQGEETALLISDVAMPRMSGLELARHALEERLDLAVVILTGAGDEDTAVQSLRLGVADYLTKPIDLDELEESVGRVLYRRCQSIYRAKLEAWLRQELTRRVEPRSRRPHDEPEVTVADVSSFLEAAADYASNRERSLRISELCVNMARHLGRSDEELREIAVAGVLHDLGLTEVSTAHSVPAAVDEDRSVVKFGIDVLEGVGRLPNCAEYVRRHHERLDGSGYPEGLAGEEIPLGAQIVGLAEFFVSLLEGGPSWPALAPDQALATLRCTEGGWYDSRVLEALERTLDDDT